MTVKSEKAEKTLYCRFCDEEIGEFWSEVNDHLWIKHPDTILRFLRTLARYEGVES